MSDELQEVRNAASEKCSKRSYPSPKVAKRCNRHAGFRVRPYRCPRCGNWHVTNSEKR